jgi:hypothetical protein
MSCESTCLLPPSLPLSLPLGVPLCHVTGISRALKVPAVESVGSRRSFALLELARRALTLRIPTPCRAGEP